MITASTLFPIHYWQLYFHSMPLHTQLRKGHVINRAFTRAFWHLIITEIPFYKMLVENYCHHHHKISTAYARSSRPWQHWVLILLKHVGEITWNSWEQEIFHWGKDTLLQKYCKVLNIVIWWYGHVHIICLLFTHRHLVSRLTKHGAISPAPYMSL